MSTTQLYPMANRENMTRVMFETINMAAMYGVQAVLYGSGRSTSFPTTCHSLDLPGYEPTTFKKIINNSCHHHSRERDRP